MMLIDYFLTNTFMCTDVCVYTLASCQTQTTMISHPVCFCLFSIFPKLDLSVCLSVCFCEFHAWAHSWALWPLCDITSDEVTQT